MYRKALRCYQGAMQRLHPDIERVEVPYESTSLPAWFVKGTRARQAADRGAVRRHGQRQGDERDLRRASTSPSAASTRWRSTGRANPSRCGCATSRAATTTRPRACPAYDYVAVAARRRSQARRGDGLQLRRLSRAAHLRLRQALRRLRLRSARCTGTSTTSSKATRRPTRGRPRARRSSCAGWSARRTIETALEWSKKFTLEGVADKVHMPDPDPARRERPRRAARGGEEALRARRLEEQDAANLHRGRRRRRALPGRQPAARRRLHRRLAAEKHVDSNTRTVEPQSGRPGGCDAQTRSLRR